MEAGKINFAETDRDYYYSGKTPKFLTFGEKKYISIQGKGQPGGEEFQKSIQLLYTVAYQAKYAGKKLGKDFTVSRLECLWWADEGKNFETTPIDQWNWKLLIRIPNFVSTEDIGRAKSAVTETKGLSGSEKVQIDSLSEGRCVQALHLGPYDKVGETYDRIIKFIEENGLKHNGPYHEIYMSNPDRTSPEKLKTIIRQPVK